MTLRGLAARMRRVSLWVFGFTGLVLVLVVVALETSAGRSFFLRAALGAISSRTGLLARAEAMEVSIVRREVKVRALSLAAPGSEPLVRVADLRLGWSLLSVGRGLTPESIDVQGVRIDLRLGADGRLNLPAGGTSEAPVGAGPPVLPLRISLRDVAVEVSDRTRRLEAHVGGISLQATGSRLETAGTLEIKEPLRWRAGSRTGEIEFNPAYFRLGRALTFEKWSARSSEGTVRLQGTWSDLFGANGLALTFEADLDLRRLAARAERPPPIDGSLRVEGRIGGALGAPQADLTWHSDDARAGGRRMKLAGHAALDGSSLDLDSASVGIAGGSVEGSGHVGLSAATESRFEARWSGLGLASLLAPNDDRPGRPSVRSLMSGQVRASWPGLEWRRAHAQAVVEATAAGTDERAGLPVAGDARLDLRGGKWTVEARAHSRDDARLAGQLGGELGPEGLGGTSVSGRLDLEAPDLAPLTSALGGPPVAGQGQGRVLVGGTFDSPRADVDLRGVDLRVGRGPRADLRAQGAIDRARLTVLSFDLHSGSAHAQATGRLLFANDGLDGHYEIDLPDLGALEAALPAGFDPGGTIHGKGSFGGTWSEPKVMLSAEGSELRMAGQTAQGARFELGLAGRTLRADSIELVQKRGRLSASGAYDPHKGQFSLSVRGQALEIAPLPAGLVGLSMLRLGGQVDLDLEGAGTGAEREGRGRIALSDGHWEGRSLGPLAADLGLTREGLRADITAADLSAHAEVRVSLDPPHAFSVAARLDGSDLKTVARWAGLDTSATSGSVSLHATATGMVDDPRTTAASLTLETLAGTVRGRPLRLDHEARVEIAPGLVRVDALALSLGESRLRLEGALDAQGKGLLKGRVEGRLSDLAGVVEPVTGTQAAASDTRIDGLADVSFVASGPPARPRVTAEGHLDEGVFRFGPPSSGKPPLPPVEHVNAKGSLDSEGLRLDHLEAAFAGASLVASGDASGSFLSTWWPASLGAPDPAPAPPRASVRARLEGDAGLALAPFLGDRVRSSGHPAVLTAVLEADAARPEAVRGEIRLEGADLQTGDIALRQQGAATLRLQEGGVALESAQWSGPLTELHLSAKARIGPQDDPFRGADLDAELSGDADLRLVETLARGIEGGGTARFRLKVAGKPSALRADGEVRLQGGALRHRPTHMALDGLTGTLRFGPSGFEMEELRGSLNGGPVEGSGALRPRESGTGYEGALRLQARNVFLEWPPGLRAGLRANLVLEPLDDGLRLAGSLRVRDGTYRTREYFSLQVLELVSRFSAGTSASRFDPLRLDLVLKSNEDVELDAVDGRLAVGIDLRLGGSVGRPEIGGRLTAAPGGQVFMSGRTYDVDSAFLDFTRGAGFEPYMQARASTRVSDYTVVADVAGPATRAKTRFASTPPLGEQDIVALLTSGRTVGAGGTGPQSDALSMASGGMLGKTGQRLGLDSLKIESAPDPQSLDFDPTAISSEADPSSRLTFSKRLASNLSATFSQSLTKAGSYTWFVAWKPKPPLELRVVQRDDRTGALEFRHDLKIGGGKPAATPPRRRRRRRRTGETVSAVSITGDPVAARPSDLKMKVGQPFDYERWLEDRDRLEEMLAREGYGEGRVLASRETPAAEDAAPTPRAQASRKVALVYDVRRGPKTSLTIEGVPSSGDLVTRIERAWRLGDFGSTIEEEAQVLTRAHLYSRDFLRAQVTSRVWASPDGDVKTLAVRAVAGAPIRSRRIVFLGNALISRARLLALVKDKRRAEAAWLAPEELREAVLAVYKSEGFLAATVEAPRITFAGDEAQLTVTIDEGPVVPIREVTVTGASRLTAETVLATAGLREGQPFKPAEIENAKARVESAYRRLGYNQATVRSHGDLDADAGSMKVELEVKEGSREVLAEVAVEGGSPKVQARIRRRLRFTPGAPVDLDKWTEARRRVYETGLFKSVDINPEASPATVAGGGDLPIKATVRVEEWPDLRLRYGLQLVTGGNLASEEGRQDLQVGAVAEVSRQTLFGRAASSGLSVQLRQKEQEARAYLSLPRTFGTRVRSSLFLTATPESTSNEVLGTQPDVRKTELTWEERMRVKRRLDFAGAYKLQWSRFDFGESVPDLGGSGRVDITLARLVGTALFDARNDLIDTSRGAFSSASLEWGAEAVGSDYPLTKTLLQQFVYLPVPGRMVMGAAARVERASGQGSAFLDTDRLQAGGANTVRGYSEDALTSRSLINFLGGSTTLLVLNAELRFPIKGPVRGVLFGDGALSNARFSEQSTRESIWSTGLGVRYVTPVGILRLDFGIPLDEGFKPGRGRVYFSLGQVF